jgi:hypothetical protein
MRPIAMPRPQPPAMAKISKTEVRALALLLLLALAGCGSAEDPQDRALNQAAADTDINAAAPANAQDAK